MSKLSGEYLQLYVRMKRTIQLTAKRDELRNKCLEELYQRILGMQEQGESIDEIQKNEYLTTHQLLQTLTLKRQPFLYPFFIGLILIFSLVLGVLWIREATKTVTVELKSPVIKTLDVSNQITWMPIEHAKNYTILIDHEEFATIESNTIELPLLDYGSPHIVEVIANGKGKSFKSAKSLPYLYVVPDRIASNVEIGNSYSMVDIYGRVYFDFVPEFTSKYSFEMLKEQGIPFEVYRKVGDLWRPFSPEQSNSFLMLQAETYLITAKDLERDSIIRLNTQVQSLDVTKESSIEIPANSRYLLKLESLAAKSYHLITNNPKVSLNVVKLHSAGYHSYTPSYFELSSQNVDDDYYLLITNDTSMAQNTTIQDRPLQSIAFDERVEFVKTIYPQVFVYTIDRDFNVLYVIRDGHISTFSDYFIPTTGGQVVNPSLGISYTKIYNNSYTKIYVVVHPDNEGYFIVTDTLPES